MIRYVKVVIGFCLISVLFWFPSVSILGLIVIADCALSDVQIANGETCRPLADQVFWPVLIGLVVAFVFAQWAFVRWALRKPRA